MRISSTFGRSLSWLASACALAAVACSSGSSSSGSDGGTSAKAGAALDTRNYCDAWAKLCPSKAAKTGKLADCKACETSQDFTSEGCYFSACSVAVGKCDNDEPGDTSILACATERGWRTK